MPVGTPGPLTRRGTEMTIGAVTFAGVQVSCSATTTPPAAETWTVIASPGPAGGCPTPAGGDVTVVGGTVAVVDFGVLGVACRVGPGCACAPVARRRAAQAYPTVPTSAAAATMPTVHVRAGPPPSRRHEPDCGRPSGVCTTGPLHHAVASKGAVMNERPVPASRWAGARYSPWWPGRWPL